MGNYYRPYVAHFVRHFFIESQGKKISDWIGTFGYNPGLNRHTVTIVTQPSLLIKDTIKNGQFVISYNNGVFAINSVNPINIWTDKTKGAMIMTGQSRMPLTNFDTFTYVPEDCFEKNQDGLRLHTFSLSLVLGPGKE